ncbi:MAG: Yip1 family protein [Steroidobacteraceae bacterium]
MDFNKLIARVKAILMTPKTEWPVIASEPSSAGDIYKNYVIWLAGAAAIASFISNSIIGTQTWFFGTYRLPMVGGLVMAVIHWVQWLVFTWLFVWIVDALAPTFRGQKNRVEATKAVAYAFTAGWVGYVGVVVPYIGVLFALAGGIYGIYLLYLGLQHTMKCPQDQAGAYTAVSIIVAVVVALILNAVVFGTIVRAVGLGGMGWGGFGGGLSGMRHSGGSFDSDSAGGALAQWAQGMEEAGKKAEEANKTGDPAAAAQAAGGVLAAALGGKGNVESLSSEKIKAFLPDSLGGLARTEISAQRNAAMGVQMSEAEATYSDNAGQSVRLKVADMGGVAGLAALASWANIEEDKQTQDGYEKTYKSGDRMIHEQWDNGSKSGEYTVLVGNRFSVEASGNAAGIDALKGAVESVDLGALEALRNEGVKSN